MESEEAKWLKSQYEEAATDGPAQKRVKYQMIKEEMEVQFPHKSFNAPVINRYIKEAFPKSFTKRVGELRHAHIFGITPKKSIAAPEESVVLLRQRAEQAETRLSEAVEENKMLKQRIDQLQRYCPAQLSDQLAHLTFPSNAVYHGPDTVQHFHEFTMVEAGDAAWSD